MPLAAVLDQYKGQCVFAVPMVFAFATTSGISFQWLPTYLIGQAHFSADVVFRAIVAGISMFMLGMPMWETLADRLGWRRMLATAGVLNAVVALLFFSFVPKLGPTDNRLAYALAAVGLCSGIIHSLIASVISALFPRSATPTGTALQSARLRRHPMEL